MVLASCVSALGVPYDKIIDVWESGELSESVLIGAVSYDVSNGACLAEVLSPRSSAPRNMKKRVNATTTRDITQSSNPLQLVRQSGLKEGPEVDELKALLAAGLSLGLPPEALSG